MNTLYVVYMESQKTINDTSFVMRAHTHTHHSRWVVVSSITMAMFALCSMRSFSLSFSLCLCLNVCVYACVERKSNAMSKYPDDKSQLFGAIWCVVRPSPGRVLAAQTDKNRNILMGKVIGTHSHANINETIFFLLWMLVAACRPSLGPQR